MKISFCEGINTPKISLKPQIQNKQNLYITGCDQVSFSAKPKENKVNVDLETAQHVANSLSTSTSGHRAAWGSKEFNPEVVELLTTGVGQYAKDKAKENGCDPMVIIGGDTRVATRESLPLIRDTLLEQGVDVLYIEDPVPTPLLAHFTKEMGLDVSVLLTASHNPWKDGGYNLITGDGAIAPLEVTEKVAKNVVKTAKKGSWTSSKEKGRAINVYPYEIYKDLVNTHEIDWGNIKNSNISIHYDGLNGTGMNVFPKLLDDYNIPFNIVESGEKEGPNPTDKNLSELKSAVTGDPSTLKIGLANDGDADRFGIVDENGKFISPNDVILLTAHHLANNKGKEGGIIISQATSSLLDLFAEKNNLHTISTPVGFKYIAEDILDEREIGDDILVAGEESGGLTVGGHIPEKDGILALLLMLDMVAKENKPISQILNDVKKELGVEYRTDLITKKLSEEDKNKVMERVENLYKEALQGKTYLQDYEFEIDPLKTMKGRAMMQSYKEEGDGYKIFFTDGSSILFRKGGTEPIVKAYIESCSENPNSADSNLEALKTFADKILTP